MADILEKISVCIPSGKVDESSPYPPAMKGMPGATELARTALQQGFSPGEILDGALIPALEIVGTRFSRREIFVPQMLLSAKAMSAAMVHLRPYFQSGEAKRKGTFIIGTVSGDLHDIGKNLVITMAEGQGFKVIDLGIDVDYQTFVDAIKKYSPDIVAFSGLLTTTLANIPAHIKAIEDAGLRSSVKLAVGGAPVTRHFADMYGIEIYSADASGAAKEFVKAMAK